MRRHLPRLVEDGWTQADRVGDHMLLTYPDGTVRFQHECHRQRDGLVIVCAPALQIGNGHTLTRNERGLPTVRASILCADCGVHGFVTDGEWQPA